MTNAEKTNNQSISPEAAPEASINDALDNVVFDGLTFEVVEDEHKNGKSVKSKGVYLVPNLITTISLLSAFVSILSSTSGKFSLAVACIFLSAVLDGLDGRLARLLNAQSAFGEQFDSLADMLAFGVAPAFLIYGWALDGLGRLGIACAFLYVACAAFRLARFNVQIGVVSKRYFVGMASPLAAIMVASIVVLGLDRPHWLPTEGNFTQALAGIWVVVAGLLMVSNLRYYSFKEFNSRRVPFIVLVMAVVVIGAVINDLPLGILTLTLVYALSGVYTTFFMKRAKQPVGS